MTSDDEITRGYGLAHAHEVSCRGLSDYQSRFGDLEESLGEELRVMKYCPAFFIASRAEKKPTPDYG
jgi:hypothetical protein